MDLLSLFVHLLVLALVFGLLYWIVTLVCGILPPPVATTARVILLVLLAVIALMVLLGEIGLWGDWGLVHPRHWR